jgi:DNA-binding MarR family transcriptional regulator
MQAMDTTLLKTADEIQRLTYDLVHYYAICDRVTVQQLGVTASQGYILLAVPDEASITMNDLSVKMRLANSTMTRMVDQLVQKGMVTRDPDPQDRRIVLVRLTEQGIQVRSNLKDTLQDLFSKVLGSLGEKQRDDILKSLTVLNDAIVQTLKTCCGDELD